MRIASKNIKNSHNSLRKTFKMPSTKSTAHLTPHLTMKTESRAWHMGQIDSNMNLKSNKRGKLNQKNQPRLSKSWARSTASISKLQPRTLFIQSKLTNPRSLSNWCKQLPRKSSKRRIQYRKYRLKVQISSLRSTLLCLSPAKANRNY